MAEYNQDMTRKVHLLAWPIVILILGVIFASIISKYLNTQNIVTARKYRAECMVEMDKIGSDRFGACTDIMDAAK
ncbi:MAG: hypothetical protein Q7R43_00340 [Candidatus Daviesbacteria bacterium]|nr:hypothetical protein [Candidatus Daviesbacteria bacterium]